jgi:hypothetical protein
MLKEPGFERASGRAGQVYSQARKDQGREGFFLGQSVVGLRVDARAVDQQPEAGAAPAVPRMDTQWASSVRDRSPSLR